MRSITLKILKHLGKLHTKGTQETTVGEIASRFRLKNEQAFGVIIELDRLINLSLDQNGGIHLYSYKIHSVLDQAIKEQRKDFWSLSRNRFLVLSMVFSLPFLYTACTNFGLC